MRKSTTCGAEHDGMHSASVNWLTNLNGATMEHVNAGNIYRNFGVVGPCGCGGGFVLRVYKADPEKSSRGIIRMEDEDIWDHHCAEPRSDTISRVHSSDRGPMGTERDCDVGITRYWNGGHGLALYF